MYDFVANIYLCDCSYFSLGLAYTLNKQYSEAINVSGVCVCARVRDLYAHLTFVLMYM